MGIGETALMMQISNILIVGYGYVGRRVAVQEINAEKTLFGLCRRCPDDPVQHINVDLDDPDLGHSDTFKTLIKQPYSVYYFAPPPKKGVIDVRMSAFLAQLRVVPEKIVLISTTGVYGDCAGQWIDENTPTKPQVDRARRRLDAEQTLIAWCGTHQCGYVILRVAGIYGQGKLPVQRLKQQTPVLNVAESPWSNRIYIDDLVNICCLAMQTLNNEMMNVTDGHPSTMTDYFNQVAEHLGLAKPPQIDLQQAQALLSDGMLSYLNESKRIKSTKITQLLGYSLRYPYIQDGLADVI